MSNIYLITYDVADPKRLKKIHSYLKDIGHPMQKSVFECDFNNVELKKLINVVNNNLNYRDDSVRIYRLCQWCLDNVDCCGQGYALSVGSYEIV